MIIFDNNIRRKGEEFSLTFSSEKKKRQKSLIREKLCKFSLPFPPFILNMYTLLRFYLGIISLYVIYMNETNYRELTNR
jgi:hypothetical protein